MTSFKVRIPAQRHPGCLLMTAAGPAAATCRLLHRRVRRGVARLLVGMCDIGGHFSRHERRPRRDVALHAAIAAEVLRLNRDLRTSRERLVPAQGMEQCPLRCDPHDELSSSFAGMSMQLHAARRLLPCDGRAAAILDALAADLTSCGRQVRELVDALHAMRERAAELGGDRLTGPTPDDGTWVRLELPLGPPAQHGGS